MIFDSKFEIGIYFLTTCLYPWITFVNQSLDMNVGDPFTVLSIICSGFFFCLVFFQDFATRFKSNSCQRLMIGKGIFFGASWVSIGLGLMYMLMRSIEKVIYHIVVVYTYVIPALALYPLALIIIELILRKRQDKYSNIPIV